MKNRARILACVVLLLVAPLRTAWAAATSEASGTVFDAAGAPIEGAVVTFVSPVDEKSKYEGKSDKKGKFFVAGLLFTPPGNWKVSVRAEGMAPSSMKVESKTQSALVAKFETNLKADGTPELVLIRPFGQAKIEFVMIPADQVPTKAPASAAGPTTGAPASDPLAQAVQRVAAGDFAGSVECFGKAIEAKPDDADRRLEFARVLFKLGRNDEAVDQAKKAAELAPTVSGPNRLLAGIYVATDKYDLADAALKKERQITPRDPALLAMLADLAEERGKPDEAIEANETIVEVDPKNGKAWLSLAGLYAKKGQADRSEAAFRKVAEIDPTTAYQTFYNIGAVIVNKPDPTPAETRKAIDAFHRAIELKPDYAPAHKQLAFALLNAGELDQARTAIESFLTLDSTSAQAKEFRQILAGLPQPKAASPKK